MHRRHWLMQVRSLVINEEFVYYNIVCVTAIPVITVPPQDAVVLLGGNVTFSCTAIGLPAPSITWSNEVNNTIPATNAVTMDTSATSILMLTDLTVSYFNQSYTCTASNLHNMTNSSAFLTQGSKLTLLCLH